MPDPIEKKWVQVSPPNSSDEKCQPTETVYRHSATQESQKHQLKIFTTANGYTSVEYNCPSKKSFNKFIRFMKPMCDSSEKEFYVTENKDTQTWCIGINNSKNTKKIRGLISIINTFDSLEQILNDVSGQIGISYLPQYSYSIKYWQKGWELYGGIGRHRIYRSEMMKNILFDFHGIKKQTHHFVLADNLKSNFRKG